MNEKMLVHGGEALDSLKRKKERNLSLDIIRIVAFSLVVYTHFFLYSGYYTTELVGANALLMTVVRCVGTSCVPLFLFLTGFLMKDKQLSGKFYSGIKNTLITYTFASGVCYIFNCLYAEEPIVFSGFLRGLLGFSSAKYAWYIEMYIGLYLLIPFLNLIWKHLQGKKQRLILIATLLFLTAVPQVANTFVFGVENWWQQPSLSEDYFLIVPECWSKFFPVTYYFTGCYIREYGIKINKWLNLVLVFLSAFAFGGYTYYRSTPGIFVRGNWQNNASPFIYLLSLFIFLFILNLDVRPKSPAARKVCSFIAELTLAAYLVSCVFDVMIYDKLKEALGSPAVNFGYIWVTAPIIIILSLLSAFVINSATKLTIKAGEGIVWLTRKIIPTGKKEEKATATVKSAEQKKPVSTVRQGAGAQPARRTFPSEDEKIIPPSEGLYKKRVNTPDDDGEEVLVVTEDGDYSAPVHH